MVTSYPKNNNRHLNNFHSTKRYRWLLLPFTNAHLIHKKNKIKMSKPFVLLHKKNVQQSDWLR